ncbi:MAG: DUF2079 domain-containing protein [Actinomycetota bacterium]|nr:DUF2079 domain-containing protein [Actinomycetota bacterium]
MSTEVDLSNASSAPVVGDTADPRRRVASNDPDGGAARFDRAGWAAAAISAGIWFVIGYARYRNLRAGASDLGIFDQAAWLLAHGHAPFVTSIGINVFADHVSPVVLAFGPLYRLSATPVWWLAAQAACLGLTVVPMRRLAHELDAPPWLATAAVVLSAPLLSAATYDVHPVVLATPAVAWALLAGRRDDVRAATIAGVLVALCRADAVTALAGVALVSRPAARRRLLLLVPIPLIVGLGVPHLLGTWQTFGRYYHHLGTGWGDALLHPWRIVGALLARTSLRQIGFWLLPVGFLPLLRLRWFAALVVAGSPLLVSTWPGIPTPWYHHGAFLVPIATGGALAVVGRRRSRWRGAAVGSLLLGAGLGLAFISPLAANSPGEVRLADAFRRADPAVAAAIRAVGPHEGVAAPNSVLGHLGHRRDAYIYPCPFLRLDGHRACHHSNLAGRARRVDVVVLIGRQRVGALRRLGFVHVEHRDGITIARR